MVVAGGGRGEVRGGGRFRSKIEALREYMFSVAIENSRYAGFTLSTHTTPHHTHLHTPGKPRHSFASKFQITCLSLFSAGSLSPVPTLNPCSRPTHIITLPASSPPSHSTIYHHGKVPNPRANPPTKFRRAYGTAPRCVLCLGTEAAVIAIAIIEGDAAAVPADTKATSPRSSLTAFSRAQSQSTGGDLRALKELGGHSEKHPEIPPFYKKCFPIFPDCGLACRGSDPARAGFDMGGIIVFDTAADVVSVMDSIRGQKGVRQAAPNATDHAVTGN